MARGISGALKIGREERAAEAKRRHEMAMEHIKQNGQDRRQDSVNRAAGQRQDSVNDTNITLEGMRQEGLLTRTERQQRGQTERQHIASGKLPYSQMMQEPDGRLVSPETASPDATPAPYQAPIIGKDDKGRSTLGKAEQIGSGSSTAKYKEFDVSIPSTKPGGEPEKVKLRMHETTGTTERYDPKQNTWIKEDTPWGLDMQRLRRAAAEIASERDMDPNKVLSDILADPKYYERFRIQE